MQSNSNTISYNSLKNALDAKDSVDRTTSIVYLFSYNGKPTAFKEYKEEYKRKDVEEYLTSIIMALTNNEYSASLKEKMALPERVVKNDDTVCGFTMKRIPDDCYKKNQSGKTKEFTLGRLISEIEEQNIGQDSDTSIDGRLVHLVKRLINDIAYLHSMDIIVGDGFSDDNILIRQKNDKWYPFYIDVDSYGLANSDNPIGTYNSEGFTPPEGDNSTPPSKEIDVWKMCVIILRLFSKSPDIGVITKAEEDYDSLNRIKEYFGDSAYRLIQRGLSERPVDRPSAEEFDNVFNEKEIGTDESIQEVSQNHNCEQQGVNSGQGIDDRVLEMCSILAGQLKRNDDYIFSQLHPDDDVLITLQGIKKIEKHFNIDSINDPQSKGIWDGMRQALKEKVANETVIEDSKEFKTEDVKGNRGKAKKVKVDLSNKPKDDSHAPSNLPCDLDNWNSKYELSRIRRGKVALGINLSIAIFAIFAVIISKFDLPHYPIFIHGLLPIISFLSDCVCSWTDEKYGGTEADIPAISKVLLALQIIPIGYFILWEFNVIGDVIGLGVSNALVIFFHVYSIFVPILSTVEIIRYLEWIYGEKQSVNVIKKISRVFYSALAILLLICAINKLLKNNNTESTKEKSYLTNCIESLNASMSQGEYKQVIFGRRAVYCLNNDGTMVVFTPDQETGKEIQNIYSSWEDISSITMIPNTSWYNESIIGIKTDGTVIAPEGVRVYQGEIDVSNWTNIVQIDAANADTVLALASDGTVLCTPTTRKYDGSPIFSEGLDGLFGCQKIVSVMTKDVDVLGLSTSGTVAVPSSDYAPYAYYHDDWGNQYLRWSDLQDISICSSGTDLFGLTKSGNIVYGGVFGYSGELDFDEEEITALSDITAIATGGRHLVALRSDGTVFATGKNNYGQCDVSDWSDIVRIEAYGNITVGYGSNGKVYFTGYNCLEDTLSRLNSTEVSAVSHPIHYYNQDLAKRDDGSYDSSFGPNFMSEVGSMNSEDRLNAVKKEFLTRIETDPIMAVACLGYIDKEMGTRYTGKFYSSISDSWISELNMIADSYIADTDTWHSEVKALNGMLDAASSSIEEVSGGDIKSLLMNQGDKHPVIVSGNFSWPRDLMCHYLTYTINIKGTEKKLSFLIESGFVPVLKNGE